LQATVATLILARPIVTVVRPYGLLGGRYELNHRGMLAYAASCFASMGTLLAFFLVLWMFGPHGILLAFATFIAGIIGVYVLLGYAVRNGTRLPDEPN
jgi:hypothetical protein